MSAAAASSEGEQPSVALRLASQPSGGDRAAQEEGSRGENARSVEAAVEEPAAAAEGNEARHFALCLAPEAGAEVQEVEESIEEMLIRLDEFCGMTDMIRSDTSQLLDEAIPLIKAKMIEMNNIYMKVDKLEKHTSSPQHTYNLPELYRTEDYFPIKYIEGPAASMHRQNKGHCITYMRPEKISRKGISLHFIEFPAAAWGLGYGKGKIVCSSCQQTTNGDCRCLKMKH